MVTVFCLLYVHLTLDAFVPNMKFDRSSFEKHQRAYALRARDAEIHSVR